MKEKLLEALAPDDTVSEDFAATFRRAEHLEPEKGLLLAVLEDAIDHFQKDRHSQDRLGRERFQEAESWIMTPGNDWIFTFDNVCELLGLDPEYLREQLKKMPTQSSKPNGKNTSQSEAA